MKKIFIFVLILSTIHLLSCNGINNKSPNDSELTLLMREMFDDGMKIKEQIINGENPEILDRTKRLLSAHSTDPEVALSDTYKLFAQSYLTAIEALEDTTIETKKTQYDVVVTSCMNCHQKLCPGPMMKIKKLYIN